MLWGPLILSHPIACREASHTWPQDFCLIAHGFWEEHYSSMEYTPIYFLNYNFNKLIKQNFHMAFLFRLSLIAPPSSPFPLLSGLDLIMFIPFSLPPFLMSSVLLSSPHSLSHFLQISYFMFIAELNPIVFIYHIFIIHSCMDGHLPS